MSVKGVVLKGFDDVIKDEEVSITDLPVTTESLRQGERGPEPKQVNLRMLAYMCQRFATAEECAAIQGMSLDTLNARLKEAGEGNFRTFFSKHRATGLLSLRSKQFKVAIDDENVSMLIQLGKSYLNQSGGNQAEDFSVDPGMTVEGETVEALDDITDAIFTMVENKASTA
jgi:hypothetical protein